jgi:hypothetical protein
MGYTPYGPPFARYLTVEKGNQYTKSYNTLDFQIVPEATMPDLPVERTIKKFVCASSKIEDINDVLVLKGNEIECNGYSTAIYSPDYRWEVSTDGGDHWNTITDKEYSRYFLSYDMLPFPTNTNEETDLILSSSILSLGKELRFRQSCVLKSFSSTTPSNLYTHYEGGLYYIKLTGGNCYTYSYYAKLQDENFAFSPSYFPAIQNVCDGDKPSRFIYFRFVRSNEVSEDMYNAFKDIVSYQIVKVNGSEETVVSNLPEYTINYTGDSLHYKCRIIACNDTISKDVWVLPVPKDTINLQNILT